VTSFQSSIPSLSRTFHQSRLWRAEEQKSETETTSSASASQSGASSDVDAVSESSGTTSEPLGQSEHQTEHKTESQTESHSESISEKASDLAEKAKETVSDVAAKAAQAVGEISPSTDKVQETASEVTEKAQATAAQASETAREAAFTVGRRTRDAVDANSPFLKSRDETAPAPPTKILYVGNLFFEVTAPQLEAEFAKYGEVTNSRVVTDNRGLSKGFAYLEFANQESANDALNALDQKVFQGRRLSVQYHKRRTPAGREREDRISQGSAPPSKTLFIGNMSYQMSDKDLNGGLSPEQ
jgi:nucleolin